MPAAHMTVGEGHRAMGVDCRRTLTRPTLPIRGNFSTCRSIGMSRKAWRSASNQPNRALCRAPIAVKYPAVSFSRSANSVSPERISSPLAKITVKVFSPPGFSAITRDCNPGARPRSVTDQAGCTLWASVCRPSEPGRNRPPRDSHRWPGRNRSIGGVTVMMGD